jgi:RNase adapter protein RapZ
VSEFLVVTGLSGAGRSTAAAALEDVGWFVIDNLPPALISSVAGVVGEPGADIERVCLVIGRGGTEQYVAVREAIDALEGEGHHVRVLFLDAPDDVLVRRFEGTRRKHPRDAPGVEASIADERRLLDVIRERADLFIDTGELNSNQLRTRIRELFTESSDRLTLTIVSFGFQLGLPPDVDLVFDCRFIPNPFWSPELRDLTGRDAPVREFVLGQEESGPFLERVGELVSTLLPAFEREGKSYLSVALGCTGGRHRSVALAEALGASLVADGVRATVFHRDVDR